MYLKKLELRGFKSFPTKTDIFFEEGVTAVVGPNGSGKSNISDAIRWVMGEQSIKSLRGEKMEDVIFSGTDTKNPMNFCEASICLDNALGEIDIDSDELIIKRKAYRSGESEFSINGKICRLKDIKEILMDTGIGKDGYSIIEQGKVEDILSSNPANRRKIFDEACGIAKFRYKKNESEKNLKKSSENLERINDIYDEIEKQIKPLERQQEKARKFIKYRDELKILEVNDLLEQNDHAERLIKDFEYQLEENRKEIQLDEDEKNNLEIEISKLREEENNLESLIEETNEAINLLSEKLNENKGDFNISKEKIKSQEAELQRKRNELKILDKKIEIDNTELDKINKVADDNSFIIEKIENELADIFEEKISLENKLESIEKSIEDNKNKSLDLLQKKENLSKESISIKIKLENLKIKELEFADSMSEKIANIDQLKLDIEDKKNNLNDLETSIKDFEVNIGNKALQIKNIDEQISKNNKEYQDLNYKTASLKSRQKTYIEMENQHEGFNRGVKEVLNNKAISGIHGALGELIKVPMKFEKAVEASLGAGIQNVVVDNENSAKQAINYIKSNNYGRVTFLPINTVRANKIEIRANVSIKPIGIMSDLLEFDSKYKGVVDYLMGRVVVIDTIDNAIKFAKETSHKYKIVTLEGEILNPGGAMTGGSLKTNSNILSRKRIIDELSEQIGTNENNLMAISDKSQALVSHKEVLLDELKDMKNSKSEFDNQIISINTQIKMMARDLQVKNKDIDNNKAELESIKVQIQENSKAYSEFTMNLESLSTLTFDNSSSINVLALEQESLKEKLESIVKIYNEKNLELVKIKQIFESNISEIERIEKNILDSNIEIDNIKSSMEENNELLNELDTKVFELTKLIDDLEKEFKDKSSSLIEIKLYRDEHKQKLDEISQEFRAKDRKLMEYKEEIFKLESKLERQIDKRDNILISLFEKYELTVVQALELIDKSINIDVKRIEKLRKAIKNLGNVNLDSIEEYEELSERYTFYKEQKIDLEKSIESLKFIISDLEERMVDEFVKNFNIINEEFVKVYKILFGGGNANLAISDMENILSCDIEITAQPPGKKMKNLSLLSGGEKALTAICILFAILVSKPTPFCILDEIEAPLDDVNVYRFGEFLKDLSRDTQFIAVTHRRGTMEVADYIYGVTMQEKGVSSVISIKFDEAEKMIES
ncbi:chromosome segregation protein SMC [Peptostreptococcus equinus]|uniref:Chromosome partition protein Smc n=1 Tax=Peptostreptococcus equinus TaxID=3003601 RepID=A0ABY7JLA7_9FIRM|nr:chromosome segregation protein SMC [Peptostreptococcus sp. CBA3647]WAW14141.1 chromosome segregation protein SMC [Peptostreptococcus sp. CBA3647]